MQVCLLKSGYVFHTLPAASTWSTLLTILDSLRKMWTNYNFHTKLETNDRKQVLKIIQVYNIKTLFLN
jgi:hypothetical protein